MHKPLKRNRQSKNKEKRIETFGRRRSKRCLKIITNEWQVFEK
jgi:hypothetical protein